MNLVKNKMMNHVLIVHGSSVGATHTKALPFDGFGEGQLSYSVPASSLALGNHTACISAIGCGLTDVSASEKMVGCCVTFKVMASWWWHCMPLCGRTNVHAFAFENQVICIW